MSIDKIFCVQCETSKQASEFDRKGEHILPRGFGNDGEQPVVLKDKICHECNQDYGKVIDQPFLRCVTSREIQKEHGMKRRKEKNTLIITGSGVIAEYKTTTAHLFECIKIAFGTHILILGEEYRDNIFHSLRKVLSDTIIEYNTLKENLKSDLPPKRDLNECGLTPSNRL